MKNTRRTGGPSVTQPITTTYLRAIIVDPIPMVGTGRRKRDANRELDDDDVDDDNDDTFENSGNQ